MIELVKLNKLCKMQSGGTPSRSNLDYYEGDFPWAKISDLEKSNDGYIYETEEHITKEALASINNRKFKPGTLLLAMYGSVGKTAITKIDLTTNQAILGINILDDELLDLKYLKYWFSTIKEKLLNRAVGAALPNISLGIVKELEIPLPSLPQQQKIASILNETDDIRQNNKAVLAKYDELTQALFLDMFGDPVSNPKGWEKVETINYCKSIVPGRDKPKSFTGNIPWVTTNDLNHLGKTSVSKLNIGLSDSEILEVKAKTIPEGSVIMTCVGDLGVISVNTVKMVVNQQLHAFICGSNLNNVFLMYNLSFQKPYMYKMSSSTTVPYMNKTVCNNTPTIVPPIELQNQFAERVAIIEEQKTIVQKSLEKSERLFNSLLQKAFKGELI